MNQTKRSIMRHLIDAGRDGLTPHELRSLTGLSQGQVSAALSELCRARVIDQGWGLYGLHPRRLYRPAPLILGSVRGFLDGAPPAPILPWHYLSDAQANAERWLASQKPGNGHYDKLSHDRHLPRQAAHDALSDLCDAGYAVRIGRGRYQATDGWGAPQEPTAAPATPTPPVAEPPQQEEAAEGTMGVSVILERVTASVELSLYQDGAEVFLNLLEEGGDVEHGYSFAVTPSEARELAAQLSAALRALDAWEAA